MRSWHGIQFGPPKDSIPPLFVILALILLFPTALHAVAAPLLIPFQQVFGNDSLGTAWKTDVSGDNQVSLAQGVLRIEADTDTYAHIQCPLCVDLVRADCTIKPNGGISWVCSLFLYWDSRNWCQVSVLESESSYYAVELIDGHLREYRHPLAKKADWYHVAIALGADCLRFQSSADRKSWDNWLILSRPENWKQPPSLLILGKGFSRDEGGQRFTTSDLNNDFPKRGSKTVSLIRDVSVERLPVGEQKLTRLERKQVDDATRLERKQLDDAMRDRLGEEELAAESDPSFASVSRHFPAMKRPREALGAKDGPQEFVVLPDGSLQFAEVNGAFQIGTPPTRVGESNCAKKLFQGYLPIVVATYQHEGLQCEQTAFGWSLGLSPDTPLSALVRLTLSNPANESRKVAVQFVAPLPVANWETELPGLGARSVYVSIPFDNPASAKEIDATEFEERLGETAAWWKGLLSKGIRIEVPEESVNQAWRAWLAYNFINVDKHGDVYEPHDGGGGFYEQVFGYSASRYCYALDLMGFPAEAEQYLDSILSFVNPDGLLVVNYGLPDTGAQLWAMGQHYQITHNASWLRKVAPTMIKMCDWIIATRKANMAQQAKNAPWYGLIKFKPYCDEPTPAYSYHTDTYLALGMREAAAALRAVGMTDPAERIAKAAADYRDDILVSMDRATLEHDGMKMLPIFPETHALLERVGYTGADYYSLVSPMVLETDVLPANDPRARLITDLLERKNGLCLGACKFQNGIDHAYSYGYWMNCLQRDEIKRVILGLYTSLAYGMSRGTYAGVEVTYLRTGMNEPTLPHLYSGTQQLLLLRNMLIREDGDQLWLGRAIPRQWLENGKEVRVENAPTLFGKTSYVMQSSEEARRITVDLVPPTEPPPKSIHLRLRHPDNRVISRVIVNGAAWKEFAGETVTLTGLNGRTTIQVEYK